MRKPDLIREALKCKYLVEEDGGIIYQCAHYHKRPWNTPEELVRAETYAWLILTKGYSPRQIRIEYPVKMGSRNHEADIVVFSPDDDTQTILVAECKRKDVSKKVEQEAIKQGKSYAQVLRAEYFLYDSGAESRLHQQKEGTKQYEYVGDRSSLPENIEAEAYILLEVDPPYSPEVAVRLSNEHSGVVYAAAVWGAYDVFTHVQKSSAASLYSTISAIQCTAHVLRTITYPVRMGQAMRHEPLNLQGAAKWAFVLLRVKAQKVRKMLDWLASQIKHPSSEDAQIRHACGILGKYDIAILLRYNRDKQLSEYVMNTIQSVWKDDLKETSTIPAIDGMVYIKGKAVS